ncbi:MAG: PUA domain-containing protein [Candidatus Kariarchaeaceae archaeon]|jgi:uncharacterized protein with predicted RNA binding PUA domain
MIPSFVQLERIKAVLSVQFPGLDSSNILNNIEIMLSRKTKRIREVYDIENDSKTLLFVLRPNDGHFLPTLYGAQQIINTGYQGQRVIMNEDASQFIRKGKSAFCKHVLKVDDGIQPNSQVFLMDVDSNLLAVGTAIQPGYAMLKLKAGVAVKPRKYVK